MRFMSRIHVECPECTGVFSVKAIRAGHRVACKLCGKVVRVPTEEESPAPVPVETESAPPMSRRRPSTHEFSVSDIAEVADNTDEQVPETRPVLSRMSYSDARDDTTPVRSRSAGAVPPLTVSDPKRLALAVGAVILLLVLYLMSRPRPNVAPVAPGVPPTAPTTAAPHPGLSSEPTGGF
jgi:hypothetical protein